MTMVEVEPKATKIRWSVAEREQVLQAAAQLALEQPRLSNLELARAAQAVLPEERQRPIPSVTMQTWWWFTDALPTEIERAREADRPVKPPPVAPEPPAPAPDLDLGEAKERIDALLLASLKQAAQERAAMFAEINARIGELKEAQDRAANALNRIADALCGGFALVPLGRAAAPVAVAVPPVLGAPGTGFAPIAIPAPATNGQLTQPPRPAPVRPEPQTRKPHVVVLSVPSGHTRNGIKDAVKDHVGRLDFWEAPARRVGFANYDYIVCTKWTATAWIAEAKLGPWAEKVRTVPGNAESISKFIRELPEIPDPRPKGTP